MFQPLCTLDQDWLAKRSVDQYAGDMKSCGCYIKRGCLVFLGAKWINWMAWCKRDVSDFFRWNFFPFKSTWIFARAFQLSSTTFPCIFLPDLHFVSEKNKDKILKHAQWTQQSRTRAFQPEKQYRRMFFLLNWKAHAKIQALWRKKNFTWKSHLRPSCTKPFNCSSECSRLLLCNLDFCSYHVFRKCSIFTLCKQYSY